MNSHKILSHEAKNRSISPVREEAMPKNDRCVQQNASIIGNKHEARSSAAKDTASSDVRTSDSIPPHLASALQQINDARKIHSSMQPKPSDLYREWTSEEIQDLKELLKSI